MLIILIKDCDSSSDLWSIQSLISWKISCPQRHILYQSSLEWNMEKRPFLFSVNVNLVWIYLSCAGVKISLLCFLFVVYQLLHELLLLHSYIVFRVVSLSHHEGVRGQNENKLVSFVTITMECCPHFLIPYISLNTKKICESKTALW